MTPPLGEEDRAGLRRLVSDLQDIDPHTRSRIDAGFRRARDVAQGIASGALDPLTH